MIGTPGPDIEPVPIDEQYRAVPYRPDTVLDGWSTRLFTCRIACLRGHYHRFDGTPRQDDVAVRYLDSSQRLIVAVADGVSAAQQSHLGATTAVRYAIQWAEKQSEVDTSNLDWHGLVQGAAWSLVEQAAVLFGAEGDPIKAEQLLATTLSLAVVTFENPEAATAHLVSVGDSGAWILAESGLISVEGGKSTSDAITSTTVSALPRVPFEVHPTIVDVPEESVLLLGTDGFGDPVGDGAGQVGEVFGRHLCTPPSLLEFGHLLDFSRETFDDDRTLVAIWPKGSRNEVAP